ncbi:MAG: hypothetical protein K2H12_12335 [Acetatifactor sp.]|nr:hypothetical protein [Acetatifactor sp.]
MTKAEFLTIRKDLQHQLYDCGMPVDIKIDYESAGQYGIGCFYDENDNKWKMYVNGERGEHGIWYESENEEEVFDELYTYISLELKYHNVDAVTVDRKMT